MLKQLNLKLHPDIVTVKSFKKRPFIIAKKAPKMLKKPAFNRKYVLLTSFQVVGGKNDWRIVYVSNLANKLNSEKNAFPETIEQQIDLRN